MKLVIAEKPVLGRAIADAIPGPSTTENGCIKKGDYIITWVFGHMLSLKEPEDYDEGYKDWNIGVLPIYFPNWGMKIGSDKNITKGQMTKEQRVAQIGKLLKKADLVIHAGDPDDEGQLLIDELLRWFDFKGPVKRLDTANTTLEAMKKALNNLSDNKKHESYGWSAYARSVSDLMVGINMSRLFTCSNNTLLTIGRVQTPTLGLVVARDALIEGHIKQKYYDVYCSVNIDGNNIIAKLYPPKNEDDVYCRINDKKTAEDWLKNLIGRHLTNIEVKKKKETEYPPLPFNLVKLQTYCSSHFGYSPKQVLEITQSLRENHKAITYNRSDCQYLSEEHFKEAPSTLKTVFSNIRFTPKGYDISIKSKCFDNSKISAHFAIIPTDEKVDLKKLTEEEKNVYLAVCKYYIAQFMPNAIKEKTSLLCKIEKGHSLKSVSTAVLNPGYRSIFSDAKKDKYSKLSLLNEGLYEGDISDAKIEEKETQPPSRYSKASLNEDMTRISKYVTDEHIKKLLLAKDEGKEGEKGSIGTSATRSDIIENLIRRGFIEEHNKKLKSTPLGRELYRILPDEIKKADMTAQWWSYQEDIQKGKIEYKRLIDSVYDTIKYIVEHVSDYPKIDSSIIQTSKHTVIGKCPLCGGDVVEGKKGFGCMNYKPPTNCKFTIWKKSKSSILSKITVTALMAKRLMAGQEIHTKRLYSKNKNKKFEGNICLKYDDKYGYYVAVADSTFNNKKGEGG